MLFPHKIFLIFIALAVIIGAVDIASRHPVPEQAEAPVVPTLTHQQMVWTYVLEWCESRGDVGAKNPQDRDGTPSYGAFQFKPDTFFGYSKQYDIAGELMDYKTQRAILERMMLDENIAPAQWRNQLFPDCVKKYGTPPKSATSTEPRS